MCETERCEMWAWQLSGYDDRVHAFLAAGGFDHFREAACTHSVPLDKITRGHTGPRCIPCLLIVGEHLAEHHRLGAGC